MITRQGCLSCAPSFACWFSLQYCSDWSWLLFFAMSPTRNCRSGRLHNRCITWSNGAPPTEKSDAPFETVSRITVPAQDFDTLALNLQCDNQSFNPWHI